MLVLTRQPGSSVTLPELGITFHVLEVRGFNQIRIGVTAPKNVNIVRTELLERPQVELGDDKTLDCGSLGQINPTGFVDAIRAASVDDDAEPLPRFMTPMQKVDYYTRGVDKPKNHHHED
jgi:carbon storage regulator CsrA